MRFYFTKRHEDALKSKKIKPSLPKKLRVAIRRMLEKYSEWNSFNNDENFTLEKTEETLKTFYGEEELWVNNTECRYFSGLYGFFIENGYSSEVLDIIEAWCDNAESSKVAKCEKELNDLFEIHNSPWRIVNATVFLVDSEYLHDEVVAKTLRLMRENSMEGALEEFNEAVSCLTGGKTKDAVIKAHKSVESVMKTVLGAQTHRFGELLADLIKSGIIPDYYKKFLRHFEELVIGSAKERNRPGTGHGQGAEPIEVPRSLAEFAVHLAGSINLFIINRWIESRPEQEEIIEDISKTSLEIHNEEEFDIDDMPF